MLKIAITGLIASGKTYILNKIESLGYKAFYADEEVKNLYSEHEIVEKVKEILDIKDFSKKIISDIIFYNKEKKESLENYIHPLVEKRLKSFFEKHCLQNEKAVFAEIPLLYETGMEKYFDYVVLVVSSASSTKKRAFERSKYSAELLEKITSSQLDNEIKLKKADFVLHSDENQLKLDLEIKNLLNIIRNL